MKNLLQRIGLPRRASEAQITDAIADALDDGGDRQSVLDAEIVLTKRTTRAYYERTHLQYEAINAAVDCLKAPIAVDSHHWRERLEEFETDRDHDLL
ncbi:hypothetical protein ACUNV4_13115 [Granulosicoccus sp. 3-233]|uniref:hypothetical protein n=1 Tax=Granulosicoccus sp. 3-233 TaxID=3417969 RepID=UPI003D338B50